MKAKSKRFKIHIKAVLPAAIPELSYDQLDGVQDGGMAVAAFMEAIVPATPPARKQEVKAQLFSYCQLDTLAMVRLYQYLSGRNDKVIVTESEHSSTSPTHIPEHHSDISLIPIPKQTTL